jgi:hypothetical protein
MKIFLTLLTFLFIQSAFSQFDEYQNKRRIIHFEEGNNIYSLRGGKALNEQGYQFSFRGDYFIKEGISIGSNLDVILNHTENYFIGFSQNIRGYFFHSKIRPFIEVNHSYKIGDNFSLNAGIGTGLAIAGITNMLGVDFMLAYETAYMNFNNQKNEPYILPSIGINLQW